MMLKTVLFYSRYVKLCSVIYPTLIGHGSCLPVEIGDFLQKAPFENLQKRAKTASKISLCSPS